MDEVKAREAAKDVADALTCDVLFYNGDISQQACRKIIDLGCGRRRAEKVLLVLITPGGDPDAGFKIGRFLRDKYKNVSVYIPGWCKSAGTLITLAADEIFIGDKGELGPLDIQIAKSDEILEMGSGLTVDAAMRTLETTASKMFFNLLLSIRRDTGGMVTTRTASELASNMVVRLLEPIYRQIDPMKIGENSRAMNITKNYGRRLAQSSKILRNAQSLEFLVSAYPDHGFVIDRQEAKLLFNAVMEPTQEMLVLSDALGDMGLSPQSRPTSDSGSWIDYLSPEIPIARGSAEPHEDDGNVPAKPKRARPAKRSGNGKPPVSPRGRVARPSSGDASGIPASANGSDPRD